MCKILGQEDIKPHKVRYYLERRDAEFEQKMAQVLCVYREVQVLKKAAAKSKKSAKSAAIVSYDEKPGIQAIATTAPDLPPVPGVHATLAAESRLWHLWVRLQQQVSERLASKFGDWAIVANAGTSALACCWSECARTNGRA